MDNEKDYSKIYSNTNKEEYYMSPETIRKLNFEDKEERFGSGELLIASVGLVIIILIIAGLWKTFL